MSVHRVPDPAEPPAAATPAAAASRAAQQGPPQARPPSHTRLTRLWTLLVLALAAHNIEEGLGMADWISAHPWLPASPLHTDPAVFTRALVIVTAAIALLAVIAVVSRAAWSAETLACLSYALMANAAGHLAMSAASWDLMPGAVTGAVLFLPLGWWTVRTLPPVRWTVATVLSTVAIAVGLIGGSFGLALLLAAW